ncbi:MRN complex-interacting protein [Chionoecetes opilio]|uniref:MRN complex-interacting protein n=1 Tax=Chionoecetes opilio TaxID=41210 RepID=A0A8J5CRT4_CHIOP|nr:MRN complex-interacting protein [Chionoecetes opilio]
MAQEFYVVRCYSCSVFQSHQVKKDKKLSAKCEYGRGSGKDSRVHVQKLNSLRRTLEEERDGVLEAQLEECEEQGSMHMTEDYEADGGCEAGGQGGPAGSVGGARVSKWSNTSAQTLTQKRRIMEGSLQQLPPPVGELI